MRKCIDALDILVMQRCFELAKLGHGNISPNPMVGAVIVYNGRIIGEGWHQKYGEGHAEVNAIANVKDKSQLLKSTIYVSLEPCHHFGKTPPCVNLILKHKIPKVVISGLDANPKTTGKSVEKLRNAGIEVVCGVLEEEGKYLIRRFRKHFLEHRPFIILKWAQSKDGFIGKNGEQIWLTNMHSKSLVHKWRSEEGAILIGTNTAETDNPRLTNRLHSGKSPLRLVLDKSGRLSPALKLFTDGYPTVVFTENKNYLIQNEHCKIVHSDFKNIEQEILNYLYSKGINSLIVEGGAKLLQSFIDKKLWDEARVFYTDKILGEGIAAPKFNETIKPRETSKILENELLIFQKEDLA